IGTFNLNNLFSRFNFRAEIPAILPADPSIETTAEYKFSDAGTYEIRTYKGKLVKANQLKRVSNSLAVCKRCKSTFWRSRKWKTSAPCGCSTGTIWVGCTSIRYSLRATIPGS